MAFVVPFYQWSNNFANHWCITYWFNPLCVKVAVA